MVNRNSHYSQRFQAGEGAALDTLQLVEADNSAINETYT